jgi:MFS family permease
LLTAVLRAAPSLIADAGSYVYSAVALWTLRRHRVERSRDRIGEAGRAGDGLRFLFQHPLLRALTAYLGVNNICNQAFLTGLLVYLEVDQRRTATQVGLAFGTYGAGFLVAAVAAPSFGRRWGLGANVIASSLLSAVGIAALAASTIDSADAASSLLMILLGCFLVGFSAPIFNVQSVALRLSVTPSELLGRVNAIVKLVSQGSLPLGALVAGGLFAALRPAPAFTVIAAASFLATAVLLISPVRQQRKSI